MNFRGPFRAKHVTFLTILVILLFFLFTAGFYAYFPLFHPTNDSQKQTLQSLALVLQRQIVSSADRARRSHLRTTAENQLDALQTLQDKFRAGALSLDEAQWLAGSIITGRQGGKSSYNFAIDAQSTIRAHPQSAMIGRTYPGKKSNQQQEIPRQGFYTFTTLDKINQSTAVSMLGYVTFFKPWGWQIITSFAVDEAVAFINIEDIQAAIAQTPSWAEHEIVLFFQDGHIWHSKSVKENLSAEIAEEFATLAEKVWGEKNGFHSYSWIPSNSSNPADKNIAFREIPELRLIAGITAPHTRPDMVIVFSPQKLLPAFAAAFLLALLLAYFATKILVRPLIQFVQHTAQNISTFEPLHLSPRTYAELAQIGSTFNILIEQLHQTKEQLSAEQQTSEAVHDQLKSEILTREQTHEKLLSEIATRKSAENYLQLFKNLFDHAIEGIIVTDKDARILTVNKSFTDITGYQPQEAIGRNPNMLSSGQQSANFYRKMWQSLQKNGSWFGEIINRKKDGTICPEWLSISQLKDKDNNTTHYFAFFHDISELKEKEKQISIMAYRDALTKLPNRAALEARLTKAISKAKREAGTLAVLFIDLDNFKNINDTLGHDKGDEVLIQVSKRINQVIRQEDTLSRLGGDEFILLSESIENESGIFHLAGRILSCLQEPFVIGFSELFINASIGIATYPNDGKNTNELIKNADMAMYRAKDEGKNKFVLFTQEMHENFLTHVRIENSIRTGLQKKEFIIYYQPKIDIPSERLTSFEALIRWNKNGLIIGPDKFIPIAEESGLIDKMSLYVLEEVCIFLNKLHTQGTSLLPVSVNMAPRTFNNLEIVETIDTILHKYRIDHKYIEFEITETTAMQDIHHTLKTMNRFRQRGISFSIDDFGTGYSSLSYLNEMPVSTLKIDKRFIDANDNHSRSIVSTIIAMSKQMQLKVIAEGVETGEQLDWLRTLGCNEAQGYFFAKPMPESDATQFIQNDQNS